MELDLAIYDKMINDVEEEINKIEKLINNKDTIFKEGKYARKIMDKY